MLIYTVILWYSFVVQFAPPPHGGNRHDIGGEVTREGGRYFSCSAGTAPAQHMVRPLKHPQWPTPLLSCVRSQCMVKHKDASVRVAGV